MPPTVAVLLGLAWLGGWWLCGRVRALPVAEGTSSPTPVSVVVPARDEARTLPTLLEGLALQRVQPAEVIVVDDGSRDATAAIARAHGAAVLEAPVLPRGWTGKAWALWNGAQAAHEDVLVMLDADVDPGPDLITSLVDAHRDRGGLVSVQPYHRMKRWWERTSAFFNLVPVMGVGLASPSWPRRHPVAAAFGPVVICRRGLYLAHGDRPEVRSAVVEDVALARSVGRAGEPVAVYAGDGVVAFRMYDRPTRLLEGWSKNIASGARAVPVGRLLLVVAWLTGCMVSGGWLLGGSLMAIVAYCAYAAQCFVQLRQLGSFGIVSSLVYPVLALVFVLVFLVSSMLVVRGEVRWKGRRVALRPTEHGG